MTATRSTVCAERDHEEPGSAPSAARPSRTATGIAIAAMLAGFALRLHGLGFGLPRDTQPDEVYMDYYVLHNIGHGFAYYYPLYDNLQTLLLATCHGALFLTQRVTGVVSSPMDYLVAHLRDPSALVLAGRLLSAVVSTAGIM